MEQFWFVALDTARLRLALVGARARAARRAVIPAARTAGVDVVDACVIPCGVRAIVRAPLRNSVRAFVRRLACRSNDAFTASVVQWRRGARVALIPGAHAAGWRCFLRRCQGSFGRMGMVDGVVSTRKPRSVAGIARAALPLARAIDRINEGALGADDYSGRLRRYVADHDSPADEATAFGRMCEVVFAAGLGARIVQAKREPLRVHFQGFDPTRVAAFDDADVKRLLASPIIRNEAKIRACIENARRWCDLARPDKSYLGRAARIAAGDDAAAGWPALVAMLQGDYARLGEAGARHTLKRWGFFNVLAHPGARRVLDRLALTDAADAGAHAQLILGAISRKLCRDAYSLEGAFVLFAALGPCRPEPQCARCDIADRCPTGKRLLDDRKVAV